MCTGNCIASWNKTAQGGWRRNKPIYLWGDGWNQHITTVREQQDPWLLNQSNWRFITSNSSNWKSWTGEEPSQRSRRKEAKYYCSKWHSITTQWASFALSAWRNCDGSGSVYRLEPALTNQKQAMTEKLKPHQEILYFRCVFKNIWMMPTHRGNISAWGFANHL